MSGGEALDIGDAGGLIISSGGLVAGITVSSGGYIEGTFGQGEIVSGAIVLSGGKIISGALFLEGDIVVSSGGLQMSDVVVGGAVDQVWAGATVQKGFLSAGSELELAGRTIVAGVTVSAEVLTTQHSPPGFEDYQSGAIVDTLDESVKSGGTLAVGSGAVASATSVYTGGHLLAVSGATVAGATVFGGGTISGAATVTGELVVSSGGTVSGAVVAGGAVDVLWPGAVEAVSVGSGGSLELAKVVVSGGVTSVAGPTTTPETVSGVSLASGAVLDFISGNVNKSGALDVASGGLASAMAVSSGGTLAVAADGSASGTTVRASGSLTDAGLAVGGSDSGALTVSSGGLASGGVVAGGGTETILAGGSVSGVQVSAGGTMSVASGGVAAQITLDAGASLVLDGTLVRSTIGSSTLSGAITGSGTIVEEGLGAAGAGPRA